MLWCWPEDFTHCQDISKTRPGCCCVPLSSGSSSGKLCQIVRTKRICGLPLEPFFKTMLFWTHRMEWWWCWWCDRDKSKHNNCLIFVWIMNLVLGMEGFLWYPFLTSLATLEEKGRYWFLSFSVTCLRYGKSYSYKLTLEYCNCLF